MLLVFRPQRSGSGLLRSEPRLQRPVFWREFVELFPDCLRATAAVSKNWLLGVPHAPI